MISVLAPLFRFDIRALWIRLEECNALPVLDRRDCKSDGQRTLAASAFLRDQSKNVQIEALPRARPDSTPVRESHQAASVQLTSKSVPTPIQNSGRVSL